MSKRQKQTTSNSAASRAGYVNIADILMKKLDAKAAAPEFSPSSTYSVNERVTHLGRLYKCTAAVTTAGDWTGSTNWKEIDLTPPVATSSTAGIVKPDGTTITVDENGVISSSGGGGGGAGHTVTVASNFQRIITEMYGATSAPLVCVKADGTTQTLDLATVAGGTVVSDVVEVRSGTWVPMSGYQFRNTDAGDATKIYNYATLSDGYRVFGKFSWPYGSTNLFTELREVDSSLSRFVLSGDITLSSVSFSVTCLLKGTPIRLADGTDKPIEEITYDDELLVWDFDNGKFSSAKPIWIKKAQTANYYFKNILASGKELLTTGQSKTGWGHRMFDMDKGKFRYTTETISDRIFTLDGIDLHKSCERIEAECEHYNVITEKHFNLFANGILTSCSLNNLYPVKNMKFVKDDRRPRPFEAYDVPVELYKGLRLDEQTGDVNELNKYVNNLASTAIERKI